MTALRRLAGLNWVTEYVIPLSIILMKACWVYLWLAWLGNWPTLVWQQPPFSLISIIILLGVSFFLTRFLMSRPWNRRFTLSCLITALLATLFVVICIEYRAGFGLLEGQWFSYIGQILLDSFHELNPLIMALLAGVYFLWWGIRWGSSPIQFSRIYRAFLTGLTGLVIILIVLAAGSITVDIPTGLYVAGFFFFSLAALALGNREVIQQKALRGRSEAPSGRLYSLLGIAAGIVLLGAILASLFSATDVWGTAAGGLKTAVDWLFDNVIAHVMTGISYVIAGIFQILKYLLNIILSPPDFDPSSAVEEATPEPTPAPVNTLVIPPEFVLAVKWGFLLLLTAFIVFLLVKAFRSRAMTGGGDGVEETRESLWSWDLFRSDLRLFLMMLWNKLRPRKEPAAPGETIPSWYTDDEPPYLFNIREIYRHLLWEAAVSGITRRRYETAEEYTQRLTKATPEGAEQLAEINRLYTRTRYGDQPPPRPQLDLANRLWRTLRRQMRLQRNP